MILSSLVQILLLASDVFVTLLSSVFEISQLSLNGIDILFGSRQVNMPQPVQVLELLLKLLDVTLFGLVLEFFLKFVLQSFVSHENSDQLRNIASNGTSVCSGFSLLLLRLEVLRVEWRHV